MRSALRLSAGETVFDGKRDELGRAADFQFAQYPAAVGLSGAVRHIEAFTNFFVTQTLSDER